MQLTAADETDLLTALYEGVFDEPLWSTFLDRLRRRVDADAAAIIFRREDPSSGFMEFRSGGGTSPEVRQLYTSDLHRLDPVPYVEMKPGRVYSLDEFLDETNVRHVRYRREIIDRVDSRYALFVRATEPEGADGWCVISRQSEDFSARDGALLKALAPHLRIALRNLAAIHRERLRANISGDVVARLNFGWLALDAGGHVVDMDGQAESLLKRSSILRRAGQGRLMPARVAADRALSDVLRGIKAGTPPRPRLIHLSDEPWLDMLVLALEDGGTYRPGRPVLAAYIQGDQQPGAERRGQLMQLFGLSHNEAGLALSLSRGRSIAESATDLDIPLESARTYSKRIYAKTGTRSQADLVRLILASVVAIA